MAGSHQYSEEEEEGLVQRPPALLGLRFRDEEERQLVHRVILASAGLVVLSVILFFVNWHHRGHFMEAFGHLVLALSLPFIGYLGVKRESPRAVWVFHLGNVQFAIFHACVVLIMVSLVVDIESVDNEKICRPYKPSLGPTAQPLPAVIVAEHKAEEDLYRSCLSEVQEKKEHIPWKLFWWAILTAPLWGLMIFAAYQAHEYYFRLRIRGLIARTNEGGGGSATVIERDPLDSDAVE